MSIETIEIIMVNYNETFSISIDKNEYVGHIETILKDEKKIHKDDEVLFLMLGVKLEHDKSLDYYGIVDKSKVVWMVNNRNYASDTNMLIDINSLSNVSNDISNNNAHDYSVLPERYGDYTIGQLRSLCMNIMILQLLNNPDRMREIILTSVQGQALRNINRDLFDSILVNTNFLSLDTIFQIANPELESRTRNMFNTQNRTYIDRVDDYLSNYTQSPSQSSTNNDTPIRTHNNVQIEIHEGTEESGGESQNNNNNNNNDDNYNDDDATRSSVSTHHTEDNNGENNNDDDREDINIVNNNENAMNLLNNYLNNDLMSALDNVNHNNYENNNNAAFTHLSQEDNICIQQIYETVIAQGYNVTRDYVRDLYIVCGGNVTLTMDSLML